MLFIDICNGSSVAYKHPASVVSLEDQSISSESVAVRYLSDVWLYVLDSDARDVLVIYPSKFQDPRST